MREIFVLAFAGGVGTVARWALSGWAYRAFGDRLPFGTLAVNVVGCLVIGVIMEVALLTDLLPHGWRIPLTFGLLGGFTTFSTFGYETMRYVEDGAWWPALANILANVVFGLAAVWLGFAAARAVFGGTT